MWFPSGAAGPTMDPVLVDLPAALAVAGDRRRRICGAGGAKKSRRYRSGPLTRSRASMRATFVPRVIASRRSARPPRPAARNPSGHPCRHGDRVEPLPRRGAEVTGLAAAVEQVKHLVGGR